MNYKTFATLEQLPDDELTVITRDEEDDNAILIYKYREGNFIDVPEYLSLTDIFITVYDLIEDGEQVYVQEDAESVFLWMLEFANIHKRCGGDLKRISEALDECIEVHAMEMRDYLE